MGRTRRQSQVHLKFRNLANACGGRYVMSMFFLDITNVIVASTMFQISFIVCNLLFKLQ